MNEKDSFVYNGAEFVYLTFGDWKWKYVRKHRELEFTHVCYVGSRYKDAPEILCNVWQYDVKHRNVRYWERPFEEMLDVALRILETSLPKTRIAIVCDEGYCWFWNALKLAAETKQKMREYEGLGELIKNMEPEFDCVTWCTVRVDEDCRKHCFFKIRGLHNVERSLVVPLKNCRYVLKSLYAVISSWGNALKEKDEVFDEMAAEMMCSV